MLETISLPEPNNSSVPSSIPGTEANGQDEAVYVSKRTESLQHSVCPINIKRLFSNQWLGRESKITLKSTGDVNLPNNPI